MASTEVMRSVSFSTTTFLLNPVRQNIMSHRRDYIWRSKLRFELSNSPILAQSRDEMMAPENSPSISMWPYFLGLLARPDD